jgi:TolA-binding protein
VRADGSDELRTKALFRLGLALGELGRWSECEGRLAELARAAPQFPNLAEAELWRGRALAEQRKTRPARAAFERTLALDQGELAAAARLGLGKLAEAEGQMDAALSEYLKVALLYAHEESVSEALFAAGRVLEAQGQADKAGARYRELVEQHPDSPFAARAQERLRDLKVSER